jgi:uncharacterized protein YqgQ
MIKKTIVYSIISLFVYCPHATYAVDTPKVATTVTTPALPVPTLPVAAPASAATTPTAAVPTLPVAAPASAATTPTAAVPTLPVAAPTSAATTPTAAVPTLPVAAPASVATTPTAAVPTHAVSDKGVTNKQEQRQNVYQTAVYDYKTFLSSATASVVTEIRKYRIEIAEINIKKRDLYDKLSFEAQKFLKTEQVLRKKIPLYDQNIDTSLHNSSITVDHASNDNKSTTAATTTATSE